MQKDDFERFKALMQGVFALYGKDLSRPVLDIWWQAMKPFDLAAVREAMNRHAVDPDRGQFVPKPADVVRLIGGSTTDGAMMAWAKVDRAVRDIGPYATVAFDDPVIHAVLADMGGWIMLGDKSEDDWPFVAREFEKRYQGYRTRGHIDHYPPRLTGIADRDNAIQGYPAGSVTLIGNQSAARAVFEGGSKGPRITYSTFRTPSDMLPQLESLIPEEVGQA